MSFNRLSGVFFVGLGLLLYFVVIPEQTETVDYGWMRPQSIPNACAILLIILGIAQAAFPTGSVFIHRREILRASLFAAITVAALWAMSMFGFLMTVPIFAAVLMLIVGERRPGWLAAGVVVLPVAIWLTVVPLLERTLP